MSPPLERNLDEATYIVSPPLERNIDEATYIVSPPLERDIDEATYIVSPPLARNLDEATFIVSRTKGLLYNGDVNVCYVIRYDWLVNRLDVKLNVNLPNLKFKIKWSSWMVFRII